MPSTEKLVLINALFFAASHTMLGQAACQIGTSAAEGLQGHVKSIQTRETSHPGAERKRFMQETFDQSGRSLNLAHETGLSEFQVFRNVYSARGLDYEIGVFTVPSLRKTAKPIDLQRHIIRFDPQDRCIEEKDIDCDGAPNGHTTYEYAGADLIRKKTYVGEVQLYSAVDLSYDSHHRLSSEIGKDSRSDGKSLDYQSEEQYRYDEAGNQTDVFTFQQGIPETHRIFAYDGYRRITSLQVLVADQFQASRTSPACSDCGLSSSITLYCYNDCGQYTDVRVFQPSGQLVRWDHHEYDEHGSETRTFQMTVDPVTGNRTAHDSLSTFTYDSHGNWIKRVSTSPSYPAGPGETSVTHRVIQYY